MTFTRDLRAALHAVIRPVKLMRQTRRHLVVGAAIAAFALMAIFAVVPPAPPSAAEILAGYNDAHAQTLHVSMRADVAAVKRDRYAASPGIDALAASGTNYDWAKAVLLAGGWPMSEANVTVLVRWMRQENGADDWWNRNNPLNNGWGSGGGGGTGTYANLVVAAEMAAAMLNGNPGMRAIVSALAASAPTGVTEQAIWASPWASGHYGNGSRWHYTPVAVVKAPAGAW